jgi:hypothetical protein
MNIFRKLLPPTVKVQVSLATEKFPEFPYTIVLRVHAAYPTQVFAFGAHADESEPHPDALKEYRQEGPLQTDAFRGTAGPNFLGASDRIASLVFPTDCVVVGIGDGKNSNSDTVIQKQTLQQQTVAIKIQKRYRNVHDRVAQAQPDGQSVRRVAQGDQETDGKEDASDQCGGATTAQNHKDHAADAATNVPGGNDEGPTSTDKGRDAPLVFKDVDLADVPAGYPARDRVAPFVNEDAHQANGFGYERLPCDQSDGNVGNVQQEKYRLAVIATGPTREHAVVVVAHFFGISHLTVWD